MQFCLSYSVDTVANFRFVDYNPSKGFHILHPMLFIPRYSNVLCIKINPHILSIMLFIKLNCFVGMIFNKIANSVVIWSIIL